MGLSKAGSSVSQGIDELLSCAQHGLEKAVNSALEYHAATSALAFPPAWWAFDRLFSLGVQLINSYREYQTAQPAANPDAAILASGGLAALLAAQYLNHQLRIQRSIRRIGLKGSDVRKAARGHISEGRKSKPVQFWDSLFENAQAPAALAVGLAYAAYGYNLPAMAMIYGASFLALRISGPWLESDSFLWPKLKGALMGRRHYIASLEKMADETNNTKARQELMNHYFSMGDAIAAYAHAKALRERGISHPKAYHIPLHPYPYQEAIADQMERVEQGAAGLQDYAVLAALLAGIDRHKAKDTLMSMAERHKTPEARALAFLFLHDLGFTDEKGMQVGLALEEIVQSPEKYRRRQLEKPHPVYVIQHPLLENDVAIKIHPDAKAESELLRIARISLCNHPTFFSLEVFHTGHLPFSYYAMGLLKEGSTLYRGLMSGQAGLAEIMLASELTSRLHIAFECVQAVEVEAQEKLASILAKEYLNIPLHTLKLLHEGIPFLAQHISTSPYEFNTDGHPENRWIVRTPDRTKMAPLDFGRRERVNAVMEDAALTRYDDYLGDAEIEAYAREKGLDPIAFQCAVAAKMLSYYSACMEPQRSRDTARADGFLRRAIHATEMLKNAAPITYGRHSKGLGSLVSGLSIMREQIKLTGQ